MKRILITGASGLLGLNLGLTASGQHAVTGVDRCKLTGVPFNLVCADLLQSGMINHILDTIRPDWLIHCAALANLEACDADPILARQLNADLPGDLGMACARYGVKMVHISTDSVFDGMKEETYTEDDPTNPVGVYPVTKLQGEQNLLAMNPDAIIARVNFFGWSLSGKRSISEFFFNNLSAGKQCNGFTDVWFCTMFVGDLAKILLGMLDKDLSGLYHATGSEAMTKYEFGIRLARRFGFDEKLIRPISIEQSELTARRSPNLRLSIHKLSTALGKEIPGVSTGLDQFYTQYQQGYPQKIRSYQQA
jgi:dTDP-4-dehydrorhamnose reductase